MFSARKYAVTAAKYLLSVHFTRSPQYSPMSHRFKNVLDVASTK
jgi:hypothetical protein